MQRQTSRPRPTCDQGFTHLTRCQRCPFRAGWVWPSGAQRRRSYWAVLTRLQRLSHHRRPRQPPVRPDRSPRVFQDPVVCVGVDGHNVNSRLRPAHRTVGNLDSPAWSVRVGTGRSRSRCSSLWLPWSGRILQHDGRGYLRQQPPRMVPQHHLFRWAPSAHASPAHHRFLEEPAVRVTSQLLPASIAPGFWPDAQNGSQPT